MDSLGPKNVQSPPASPFQKSPLEGFLGPYVNELVPL